MADPGMRCDLRILGPLEVRIDGGIVTCRSAKERLLLAALVIDANHVVSIDRVVDVLWGDEPPATARSTIRTYASHLRKRLQHDDLLQWREPGYVLVVDPDQIDAHRFEAALADGSARLRAGDAEGAADRLRAALSLWRGPVLADLRDEPFVEPTANRLEELRLVALERRLEADLACGRHADVVGELEALVADHPLREELVAHLIVARYRSGRQAEALAAYQGARAALLDELGLDPSPQLQRLEAAVLAQDPVLAWEPRPAPAPPPVAVAGPATTTPPMPAIRFVTTTDGIRIAVSSSGSGPPLVFVRAWISHLEHLWEDPGFRSFVGELAATRRVVRFDMRGNGLSDRDVEPPDLDDLVLDLEAVMAQEVEGPAIIWGTTFGGPVAARYAARHPERVRGLVLDGTFARGVDIADDERWESFRTMLSLLRTLPEPAFAALSYLTDNDPVMARDRRMARAREAIDGAFAEHLYNRARSFDVSADLEAIRCPTLVLHRDRSRSVPFTAGRRVASLVPGAELVRLEGSAHNLWEGDPAPALAAISAFVERMT